MRIVAAVLAGVVIGALYTVSPLTLWCVPLIVVVLTCAGRGLPPIERRWLHILVIVALAARLAAIGAVFIVNTPMHDDESVAMLSGDEAYGMSRALRTRDVLTGAPVTQYDYFVAYDEYGRNTYITILTAIQALFGPTPYSMRLFNTVLFMTAGVLLFRTVRSAFGPLAAFGGLTAMMFLPTLFYWSISLLKEPLYLVGGVLTLTGAIAAARTTARRDRILPVIGVVMGLVLTNGLRPGGLALAVLGLGCGIVVLVFFSSPLRLKLTLAAAGVAVALAVTATPRVRERLASALDSAAKTHAGHVFTQGHAYKLLDPGFYVTPVTAVDSPVTLTAAEAARYVTRAVISFVVVPVPWELASTRELSYLPEQLLWYVLVALFPVGLAAGWKRDPLVVSMFAGYVVPTAVALALTNGNVGTLLRLRGMIIPYVVWVSAVGGVSLLEHYASTSSHARVTA